MFTSMTERLKHSQSRFGFLPTAYDYAENKMDVSKTLADMQALLENHDLTPYEQSAVSSMLNHGKTYLKLSAKQIKFFESIASNYTEEAMQKRNEWFSLYDEKKIHDMKIIAAYYKSTNAYYVALASKVLEGELLTEKQYRNMCENKYARAVLREHYREPRFEVGQIVYAKTNMPPTLSHALRRGGIIMQANAAPVISHAKGSKRYLVLPVGQAYGEIAEERWLKTRK